MRVLIVTPMRNEEANVEGIHESLRHQTIEAFDWVVVDDGSTDETRSLLKSLVGGPEPLIVTRENSGGLIGGSAYLAWRHGITQALALNGSIYSHVMKLDADVRLPKDYLGTVIQEMKPLVGLAGGVIANNGMREQNLHVPGPVKLYTFEAYQLLRDVPSAIGFDVLDEVALAEKGLATRVVREAKFSLARAIGASEGSVHGRYRNGRVCRWTGYSRPYFALHALRYLGRKPQVIGSIAMIVGYARAGNGPYPRNLRAAHAQMQRAKLREATRSPIRWIRQTYAAN